MKAPVTARTALLQVLLSGPGYGRELSERLRIHTAGNPKTGEGMWLVQGSLYPELDKLVQAGLVEAYGLCACGCGGATPLVPPQNFAPEVTTRGACSLCNRASGEKHASYCRKTVKEWNSAPGEYLVPLHYLPGHEAKGSEGAKEGRPRVYYRLTKTGEAAAQKVRDTLRRLVEFGNSSRNVTPEPAATTAPAE